MMPKCIVCGELFYDASYWDPAEDCACGGNIGKADEDDWDPLDIQDMRDEWKETQWQDEYIYSDDDREDEDGE